MAQPRRRFSIYQRGHKVTVGPLGFDVPIPTDTAAFPLDDQVDEEDQISDVDYPSPGSGREAKRQRIESHARDYLCGKRLDIYSASLKGPIRKGYWGGSAKVTGTAAEIKASDMKVDILEFEQAKRQRVLQTRSPLPIQERHQPKITATLKAGKPVQVSAKQTDSLFISDSQPTVEISPITHDTASRTDVPRDLPLESGSTGIKLSAKKPSTGPRLNDQRRDTTSKSKFPGENVPETSPTTKRSQPAPKDIASESKDTNAKLNIGGDEPPSLTLTEGTLGSDIHKIPLGRKPTVDNAKRGDGLFKKTTSSEPNTSQVQEETIVDFDLENIEKITEQLAADDTTTFFQNNSEPIGKHGQSPATALKQSLPKVDTRKNTRYPVPTSPTAEAIFRKATRPPLPPIQRRGELGNGLSLREIIAKTARGPKLGKRPRKSKASEAQNSVNASATKTVEAIASTETQPPAPAIAEELAASAQPIALVTIIEESVSSAEQEEVESVVKDPAPNESHAIETEKMDIVSSPVEQSRSGTFYLESSAIETQPPVRFSQMPTPLPPSPLQLLNAPKQVTPNIPETVVEEVPEKPLPLDTSLKENDSAFHPGPRRAKRTAPKARAVRPIDSQPSSNEELKATITARKIATPISRLQEKMAEYSPVSPMVARPVSPIPESQTQTENQKSSIRRQEQLREEQQRGSSQLSSPPPSSPTISETPALIISEPQEPVVEVPASSKDVPNVEPASSPEPSAGGAPLSPPQETHEEESTIEISSGHYRKIEEALKSAGPIAIPLVACDMTISQIPASHPANTVDTPAPSNVEALLNPEQGLFESQLLDNKEKENQSVPTAAAEAVDDDSTDDEDLDQPPKTQPPRPSILVPETPVVDTQASRIAIPESFKKAIGAPLNYAFQTPGAPLPPRFVSGSAGEFTPADSERVAATSPVEARAINSTAPEIITPGPFTSPSKDIEFTPFRLISSPKEADSHDSTPANGDTTTQEPTTMVSPFTFSQFMKPVEGQYEVSRFKSKGGNILQKDQDDRPSSYDLENVLGGVEDYLMSDVYDVDEEAKRLSENRSFGEAVAGGDTQKKGGLLKGAQRRRGP
ncbi:hypothetical protein ABW20_dc0107347 [Dactylellina cionopaga]|nr:hypothetical protein ABW20_dc0107347 [Dactylellina cionopaga]